MKRRFRDTYDRAISEPEARRSTIEQEAVQIVSSWKPTYLAPVVRLIQEYLNYLGYTAGPVDSLYGHKTRDAILKILQSAGMVEDSRITYSLRDELRQVSIALREEYGATDSSTNDAASDGPGKWFGLVRGTSAYDVKFIETTKVPKVTGQAFGWYIYWRDS